MTYPTYLTLKLVASILGLLYLAGHLPGALFPVWFTQATRPLPRSYPLGILFMGASTLWFMLLTYFIDLGELTPWRQNLILTWLVGGLLTIIFVPIFLAARGLGCLLLLSSVAILDSAFLVETPLRWFVTLLAYVWIIAGMALVYYPYLLRDGLAFATKTPERCRAFCWPGAAYGLLLLILAMTVYP